MLGHDCLLCSCYKQCTTRRTLLWGKVCCILLPQVAGLCSLHWDIVFTCWAFVFCFSLQSFVAFLPTIGYAGEISGRETKALTGLLWMWKGKKANKNIMNNANFNWSQWVRSAIQEGGREQWELLAVWQWLLLLCWPRNCNFPVDIWNEKAAEVGGVDWEEPRLNSRIS